MHRVFRLVLILIFVLIIAFGLYFWTMRVSIFERFLSKQLNSQVTIENVKISWNKLVLQNLQLKGPHIYTFQGTLKLEVRFLDLLKQPIHLKKIVIEDSLLTLELYNGVGSDNNWSRFIALLPSHGEQKIVIDRLNIENLRFEIKRSNGKNIYIPPITHLEFNNLGSENPLTVSQVVRAVFQTILSNLRDKPFLGSVLENVLPLPASFLKGSNAAELYKEEAKGLVSDKLDFLKRKTHEATEFLQDLFSK